MQTKILTYFPRAFLTRWCIVVALLLAVTILFLTVYRSSVIDKFSDSYGARWPETPVKKSDLNSDLDFKVQSDSKRKKQEEAENGNVGDRNESDLKRLVVFTSDKGEANSEKIADSKTTDSFAESNCPKWDDDSINVHFILHTHDDPGWLKTPDQYYDQDVNQILHEVIRQLIMEPQRKFVYSEMYYFSKWWNEQTQSMKQIVTRLVQNGQLEFVGGGWVQNDDASTHYTAAIDQLAYGWAKIDDYFGESALPKMGWQIDCFGYSQEQADIFQQMGMEEEVIVRLHHKDIEKRRKAKQMEFQWRTSPDRNLFTHVLYDHYTAPHGFQYEVAPFDTINEANQKDKVQDFLSVVRTRSQSYQTNHLLMIMGHDFVYKNGFQWFDPIDTLIRKGNLMQLNGSGIQLFYSTPSCYFKAVKEAASNRKVTWPSYSSDFFPYATSPDHYWTGYFSSRASLKRLIRIANNYLLTAQNLAASINMLTIDLYLNSSREALYTTLHHDGITGTCKQAVADEYVRYALRSIAFSQKVINIALPKIAGRKNGSEFDYCPLLNVSVCAITQKSDHVAIVILNGFSHERSSFIRLPIDNQAQYELLDYDGKAVPFQLLPVTDEVKQFKTLPGNRCEVELGFFAQLPSLGFASFQLTKRRSEAPTAGDSLVDNGGEGIGVFKTKRNVDETMSIDNEFFKLEFDGSGKLSTIVDKKNNGHRRRLVQDFFWYASSGGTSSGAYMMRPMSLNPVSNTTVKVERIQKGPLVEEIRQTFAPWVTQVVRLYKGQPYVEFEWTTGPLDPEHIGKEVITRFSTDLKTNGTFYTDANGRRLMKRKRDPQDSTFKEAGSYYPSTAVAAMRDDQVQLGLVMDRAMGAASIWDGSLELMTYRKVLYDDGAGMGEGLNERDQFNRGIIVRGKIWLTLAPIDQADVLWRRLAKEMFYEPIVAFSKVHLPTNWPNKVSQLRQPLPAPIHLLTLKRLTKDGCLIRFEHFQSTEANQVAKVEFRDYFRGLELNQCNQTQLGGWQRNKSNRKSDYVASLRPTDILTFKCRCRSSMLFDRS